MIKTFGFKQLAKMLDEERKKLTDKAKIRALIKGGKVIAKRAAELVKKKSGILAKSIKVVRYKEAEQMDDDVSVAVTASGRGYYGHIVEDGYGRQAPQPFMRPALAEKEQEAIETIATEIKKELDK